jgi:hypothetical protein
VAEVLEHERAQLMPMPEPFNGCIEKPARLSSTCLVSVAGNRYSAPCELAGQMISTQPCPSGVAMVADDKVVARRERLGSEDRTRCGRQHYIPLLQRKPGVFCNGAALAVMPEPRSNCAGRC